jgi:hypothetical protein
VGDHGVADTGAEGCREHGPARVRVESHNGQASPRDLRRRTALGYTVANTNRESGLIVAERQASGLGTALLTGKKYFDQMTVLAFENDGQPTVRVTVGRAQESAALFGNMSRSNANKPSDEAMGHARTLLEACAPGGTIQVQTSGE